MSDFARTTRPGPERAGQHHPVTQSNLQLRRMLDDSPRVVAQAQLADVMNGVAPLQRKKILNLGSGTDPDNFLGEQTVKREDEETHDVAVNVDSGHMLLARLLMAGDSRFFETLEHTEELEIKWQALQQRAAGEIDEKSDEDVKTQLRRTDAYKEFVLRAWFTEHPGRAGFRNMLETVGQQAPDVARDFQQGIAALQAGGNFRQGFAEDLTDTFARQEYDEVHVISALGFDVINDEQAIQEVAALLKPGGKLIVTAEKTGMVSKALKMKRVKDEPYPVPDVVDGVPQIKPGIMLLDYFTYDGGDSSYGGYEEVFEGNYQGITTAHTTGGGFGGEIPFARLAFIKKARQPRRIELKSARRDYENAQWINPEEFGEMSFEQFLEDYTQDM